LHLKSYEKTLNQCFWRVKTRAKMFNPNTAMVIKKTPAHANCCQFWYGLMANLKMVTGKLATGPERLEAQN